MSLQRPQPLLNHQAAMTSVVIPQPVTVAVAKFAILEFFMVACAASVAGVIYHQMMWGELPASSLYIPVDFFLAAAVESTSIGFGHYKNSQSKSRHALLFSGFAAVALAFSFLLSALFLLKITDYSRVTFVFQFFAVSVTVLVARAFFHSHLRALIAAGKVNARRVVLVGDPDHRTEFVSRLKATAIQTVGWFSTPAWGQPAGTLGEPECAEQDIRALIEGCRRLKPDDILVLAQQDDLAHLARLRAALSEVPAGLHIVPVEAAAFLAAARIVEFGNTGTIQVLRPPLSAAQRLAKRVFDVVVAVTALVVLSPVLLVAAVAVKLNSRGPVFFRQKRHGYNNETIEVFKFRSMTHVKDHGTFVQAVRDDDRCTSVGRVLRRTNIDELPQLLNVLRGEMSIVGPRPHATEHNRMFEDKIIVYSRRHVVKPGITGWAQVNGFRGPTETLEKMKRRVELDLWYIDNWSFWLDIRIVIMTLFSKVAYTNAF